MFRVTSHPVVDGKKLAVSNRSVSASLSIFFTSFVFPEFILLLRFSTLFAPLCRRKENPNLYVYSLGSGDRGGIGLSSLDFVQSMAETRRFSIGYALAPKKRQSFIQPSLVNLARERGVDLVPIDTDRPLKVQGPFDCVIHKIYGEDWRAQLKEYAENNPFVPIIDHPDAIERLHNRISMLQVVSELEIPREKETFGIPSQIVVYDAMFLSDSRAVCALRFPVIAKPLVADGSAKSHKMSLVYHRDGLLKLKPPLVLQEFVNHGGVIFKVYVVGECVKCVKRKSLPDVSLEKLDGAEGSLSFSQVSNMTAQDTTQEEYYENMQLEAELPPLSFLTDIARGLRRATSLNLFNFDVIRDSNSDNHYFVIDINYFPGYAKMPAYETILTDFFCKIVHENTREDDVNFSVSDDVNEAKLGRSNHFGGTEVIENNG